MKIVTIDDVAKRASVSKSTVSQYLNKRYDYMSEQTKERIKNVIEELGYQPNIVARSLKQKTTSTIGVIVANILHVFSTQVIRAIEDICHDYDFHIIVCNADDDPKKEKKYIEMLRAKQVDGMIIFPTGGNISLYKKMINEQFPIVFVDRSIPVIPISSIILDNEKATKLAVDYIVDKGYERIAIMTTSIIKNISTRIERISGYKKALKDKGIIINENYIKSLDVKQIQEGLREMLSLENPPQAVIAGNDLTLMEILAFIKNNHLKIPANLGIIGIDDVSFANFFSPSLTTIAQPTFEMGKAAAEILLNKIQKKEVKTDQTILRFEPKLIIRESC